MNKLAAYIMIPIIIVLSILLVIVHKSEGTIVDKWEVENGYSVMAYPLVAISIGHQYGISVSYEHLFGTETNFFYIDKERYDTLEIGDHFDW